MRFFHNWLFPQNKAEGGNQIHLTNIQIYHNDINKYRVQRHPPKYPEDSNLWMLIHAPLFVQYKRSEITYTHFNTCQWVIRLSLPCSYNIPHTNHYFWDTLTRNNTTIIQDLRFSSRKCKTKMHLAKTLGRNKCDILISKWSSWSSGTSVPKPIWLRNHFGLEICGIQKGSRKYDAKRKIKQIKLIYIIKNKHV
jgi:hypothetical protein